MKPRSRSSAKRLLRPALVALFGGADEIVVADAELPPEPLNSPEMAVANSAASGRPSPPTLDLLPVLSVPVRNHVSMPSARLRSAMALQTIVE